MEQDTATHPTPSPSPIHPRDTSHTPPSTSGPHDTHRSLLVNPIKTDSSYTELYCPHPTNQQIHVIQYSPSATNRPHNHPSPNNIATLCLNQQIRKTYHRKRKHPDTTSRHTHCIDATGHTLAQDSHQHTNDHKIQHLNRAKDDHCTPTAHNLLNHRNPPNNPHRQNKLISGRPCLPKHPSEGPQLAYTITPPTPQTHTSPQQSQHATFP
jgi:hypothetical protein